MEKAKPFTFEEMADLATVRGFVTFRLRDTFGSQIGSNVYAEDQGQGSASEALENLIGNNHSLENVLKRVVTEDGNSDLKADKILFGQYKAAVLGTLNDLLKKQ